MYRNNVMQFTKVLNKSIKIWLINFGMDNYFVSFVGITGQVQVRHFDVC